MRAVLHLFAAGMLVMAGCAGHKGKTASPAAYPEPVPAHTKVIVTPDATATGRVVRVNANARFAVLNFPVGSVPAVGQRLDVYRAGLKVGEVKVTGPQQDDNTVADILNGEAQTGDELRAK